MEPAVTCELAPEELSTLLDPAGYLGSADEYVGRVLEAYELSCGGKTTRAALDPGDQT